MQTLSRLYPHLAEQWHPTKNGDKKLDDFTKGSKFKAWWKCSIVDDHEYQSNLRDRIAKNTGCSCCRGLTVVKSNCLSTTHPEIAKQWNYKRNNTFPENFTAGSAVKVWWQCAVAEDHEWFASIGSRVNQGCAVCAGKKVVNSNSLGFNYPELIDRWGSDNKITPFEVTPNSNTKVWWQCPISIDHKWEAACNSIITSMNNSKSTLYGCPYCRGLKVAKSNCLATLYPHLIKQWDTIKNGNLTPYDVTAGSDKKIWWNCESNHQWSAAVDTRTRGRNCPFCTNRKTDITNCLATTYPEIIKDWDYAKNINLSPYDVAPGSHLKAWWKSSICGHEWQAAIKNRTFNNSNCPQCYLGWTKDNIYKLILELTQKGFFCLSPMERLQIFIQNGLLNSKNKPLAIKLTKAKSLDELKKLLESNEEDLSDVNEDIDDLIDEKILDQEFQLPEISIPTAIKTSAILASQTSDLELIEFLIVSGSNKLWSLAFSNKNKALEIAKECKNTEFEIKITERFENELAACETYKLPPGYSFLKKGKIAKPNLMQ